MKISSNEAYVKAVTVLGENHGDDIVSAIAVKLEFTMLPRMLNQFSRDILPALFDEAQIPRIPEMGVIQWKKDYEKATFFLAEYEFKPVDVKRITFAAREGFLVDVGLSVKVSKPTAAQRGQLSGFIKQTAKIVLEGMQLRIDEPEEEGEEEDEKAAGKQPELPAIDPLIGKDGKTEDERRAEKTRH